MSYSCFEVQIENHIAQVILNRPEKRNAMNADFWRELPEIIRDIDAGAKARVIVVSSTGPHFSAGADLSSFNSADQADTDNDKREIQRSLAFYNECSHTHKTFSCLEEARVPVLCCIQGGAIGGGFALATACDVRYATEDAFLTIQETNIGMTADVGTFPRLVKLIPEGYVRELAYTGRRVSAAEAKQMGLINEVFPDQAAMLTSVMGKAAEIARKAPLAVYGCKRMINYARDHNTADGLDYIALWNAGMLSFDEIGEAISANAEGRPGDFAPLPPLDKTLD